MNTPLLSRYRNGEFLQYMTDVLDLIDDHDVAALSLTAPFTALQEKVTMLDGLFQQQLSSGITQDLIEIDTKRDKAFMGIKGYIESHLNHYDTAKIEAAERLLRNMSNYGTNIPRLSYQEETAVIKSMLADWDSETDLTAAVSTLNLGDWTTELQRENQRFTDQYLARVTETSEGSATNFTEAREEGTVAYRDLMAHVSAHATLGSNPTHEALLKQVSILAKQYNQTVSVRSGNPTEIAAPPSEEETTDTAL